MELKASGRSWKRKWRMWSPKAILKSQGYCMFPLLSASFWPFSLNIFFTSQLLFPSCFFPFFLPPPPLPSPLRFFIFFSLTSILFSPQSPHTPSVHWLLTTDGQNNGPCHTALRQTIRWWEEGWGAGAAVTRHYAHWVQAATNLRPRWFNSQMDIWGSLYTHTHTKMKAGTLLQEVVLSGKIFAIPLSSSNFFLSLAPFFLALLSVFFTSSISGRYGIDSSYWLPIAKANRR